MAPMVRAAKAELVAITARAKCFLNARGPNGKPGERQQLRGLEDRVGRDECRSRISTSSSLSRSAVLMKSASRS